MINKKQRSIKIGSSVFLWVKCWFSFQFIFRPWLSDQTDAHSLKNRLIPNLRRVYVNHPFVMHHAIELTERRIKQINSHIPPSVSTSSPLFRRHR